MPVVHVAHCIVEDIGFEPMTYCLQSNHSTTELIPLGAHDRSRTYTVWILSPPSLPVGIHGQTPQPGFEPGTK